MASIASALHGGTVHKPYSRAAVVSEAGRARHGSVCAPSSPSAETRPGNSKRIREAPWPAMPSARLLNHRRGDTGEHSDISALRISKRACALASSAPFRHRQPPSHRRRRASAKPGGAIKWRGRRKLGASLRALRVFAARAPVRRRAHRRIAIRPSKPLFAQKLTLTAALSPRQQSAASSIFGPRRPRIPSHVKLSALRAAISIFCGSSALPIELRPVGK